VRWIRRRPVVFAVAALAVAGLACTVPASAAVQRVSRANAAGQQVPSTKAAWQKDLRHVRMPGRGCFHTSYPSLTWHAAKCGTASKVPFPHARPGKTATHAGPAQVGGTGGDYVATTPGLITEATGTFSDVSSGISETGQIAAAGTAYPDGFSLQLNANPFSTPLCSGGGSGCVGWQQFLYEYGNSGSNPASTPLVEMQYWLLDYTSTTSSKCPSTSWTYFAGSNDTDPGCYMNSKPYDVPAVTAGDLASTSLSGAAAWSEDDDVELQVGSAIYGVDASDSVLDLAAGWDQTEWGVFGDGTSSAGVPSEADFTSSNTSLIAQTAIEDSSGPPTVSCGTGSFTAEYNNLNFTTTPAVSGDSGAMLMASEQTNGTADTSLPLCTFTDGNVTAARNLAEDSLTGTWQAQSDLDSTGSPQPLPTTTADCGNWSGGDGTQVVGLGNGEDLWSFGDTILGPAVARQDFFNNGSIGNSMVVQNGSAFTTITGGSGCASGDPYDSTAPITDSGGTPLWPASSIVYGSDVEKFYYAVNSGEVQEQPEVAEIPQADLESGDTYSQQVAPLDACTANPIMWGAATISSGGYTYIYGSQQFSSTGGDVGGDGGGLYLARTTGDPSDQGTWQYYLGGGNWSAAGASCSGLTSNDALGNGTSDGPIEVPTEFSVTSVNGEFWLVDEDPANGDLPGWAVAHEATTPTGFSNNAAATLDLFEPTAEQFPGIDDNVPGLFHYAVRMLEPSAVTPTLPGNVVIVYNVNDSDVDAGCIPLIDYDANAYRPRFADVPTYDLLTNPAAASATDGSAARDSTARPRHGAEPPGALSYSTQVAARGEAQLKAASSTGNQPAAADTSWTYNPDAVPADATWNSSCPSSYAAVDPDITFTQNPDGSVEVSWPNQGPDVWYWFHWQDDTTNPSWQENELWTEGPNADGYLIAPPAGAEASTSTTISQVFPLPPGTQPGDTFSFWVQAFAAGNGNVTSPDSSATAVSYTPTSPSDTITGLTATAGTNAVTLNWTAVPTPVETQAVWYSVRYKTLTASSWTYTTDYVSNTAAMTPLSGGTEYEFEVAATDDETNLSDATWSAPVDATPQT
jgi:hypothetical protein